MSSSRVSPAGAAGAGPGWPVRTLTEAEFDDYLLVCRTAMHRPAPPSTTDTARVRARTELDRTIGVFDGTRLVGTATAFSFTMTMPGGPRAVAGVSAVTVWPTHRRRGILSALMRHQLADIRDRGERVAALFASEGGIYQRFGYGPASRTVAVDIATHEARLRPDIPRDPALRLRLSTPEESRKELAAVHSAAARQRVGEFQRDDAWWDHLLHDSPETRDGFGAFRCALAEDDAGPLGYVLYRTRQRWDDYGVADSPLRISEMYATAPAASALLWEHVLGEDLVSSVTTHMTPPDDPVYHLLADRYRARTRLSDNLWLRLVDVPGALEDRSYVAPVETVIEVADRHCPWNAGRWRLSADHTAARCAPTDAAPDIRLDVAHLGSAYLGDQTLGSYLAAGAIAEDTPGAVERLDAALSRPTRAHCGVIF
ncbi:GNAT family N-acetyltransferase [Nocardiopsis sediminis]|uniref:GNAT family N-acetyltransferase n=1 Tax=Nocardiopsis sediminis TaxID=1778267 RepID=A0ABV8FT14_9ACTN